MTMTALELEAYLYFNGPIFAVPNAFEGAKVEGSWSVSIDEGAPILADLTYDFGQEIELYAILGLSLYGDETADEKYYAIAKNQFGTGGGEIVTPRGWFYFENVAQYGDAYVFCGGMQRLDVETRRALLPDCPPWYLGGVPGRLYADTEDAPVRPDNSGQDLGGIRKGMFLIEGLDEDEMGVVHAFATFSGTASQDVITAEGILSGHGGDDRIIGGAGDDVLYGGDGNDTLIGGGGSNLLSGGSGFDMASYANASSGVAIDLSTAGLSPTPSGDWFTSIESLIGSVHNDTLVGDDAANELQGGGGNDMITGGWGDDLINGGAGNDTVRYDDTPYGSTVNLANHALNTGVAAGDTMISIENVIGSDSVDILIGDGEANRLEGRGGNDTLTGGWGNDRLDGGSGTDTVRYDDTPYGVTVNLNNSTLNTGAAAGDVLVDIENVIGSSGIDILIGNFRDNVLDGRSGHDTIDGGWGNDVLKGWYGWDTFVFSTMLSDIMNVDHLADFYAPDDVMELHSSVFSGIGQTGTLAAYAFTVGASATSAEHRIVYHYDTGSLSFDADGSGAGAQVKFATFQRGTALTAGDVVVV